MSRRSERFNKAMRSVDFESVTTDKNRATSDKGLGVERLLGAVDYDDAAETARENSIRAEREDLLFAAETRLVEAGKGYLIRVLLLIVENGADRELSLKSIPKRTYFRHRNELLWFFSQQPQTSNFKPETSPRGTQVDMDI